MPYSGLSSTLLSVDPNKLYALSTPPTSVLGSSSDERERDRDPLRPTPYLVPRESTTDSTSDIRKGKGKKHARELSASNESATRLSATSDALRSTSASPSQLGSADGDEGNRDRDRDGDGERDGDVLRFDDDERARLSRSLTLGSAIGGSLHLGFSDFGGSSEVGSNSGEATLPPPYAHYFGGGGAGAGARTEEA